MTTDKHPDQPTNPLDWLNRPILAGTRDRVTTEPGGCECVACGAIFIGAEWHSRCRLCAREPPMTDNQTAGGGGYPKDVENPDEWKAFLARYLANRVTNGVHDGIGLVALHIVDAIREARTPIRTERLPFNFAERNADVD